MLHLRPTGAWPGCIQAGSPLLAKGRGVVSRQRLTHALDRGTKTQSHIADTLARLMHEVEQEAINFTAEFGQTVAGDSQNPAQPAEAQPAFQVDLRESAKAYQCIADLPGIAKEDIQVQFGCCTSSCKNQLPQEDAL